MAECLISIGSNLGDSTLAIDSALSELQSNSAISLRRVSRRHVTQPIGGPPGQNAFVNAAALVETSLSPTELLGVLQALESRVGRTRSVRWGARTLDLDMLLYDKVVMNDEALVLPHPRMAFRRFVLVPQRAADHDESFVLHLIESRAHGVPFRQTDRAVGAPGECTKRSRVATRPLMTGWR